MKKAKQTREVLRRMQPRKTLRIVSVRGAGNL